MVVLLVAAAGVAWACHEPQGTLAKASVVTGETVEFAIADTEPGASYVVAIDGERVASGVDRDAVAGVRGSFVVPDLGPRTRCAEFVVSHEGFAWSSARALEHRTVPFTASEQLVERGERVKLRGDLESGLDGKRCVRDRLVRLQRRRADDPSYDTFESTRTNEEGRFGKRIEPKRRLSTVPGSAAPRTAKAPSRMP